MEDIGLARGTVRLEPHNPAWAALFAREADTLKNELGAQARDIQHVGSTAIPALPAKPILDIAILVENLDVAAEWASVLAPLGYWYKGLEPDNPGRRFFARGPDTRRTVYLHVVGQCEFGRLILFRDTLRSDARLVRQYANLKGMLASQYASNREQYTKAKERFIQSVLVR